MNTLINIQKQGERNSQEIDHPQISDDDSSKSAFKSPWSFPWVPKLCRWVSCHQSPPTTSSYLSTKHSYTIQNKHVGLFVSWNHTISQ
jgi:hypothetical protein